MVGNTSRRSPSQKRRTVAGSFPTAPASGRRVKRHTPQDPHKSTKRVISNTGPRAKEVLRSTTARHHIAPTTKKSAAFSLVAPGGESVAIAGTFTNWEPQPMTKGVDGVWRITLQLAPGLHEYRFQVDSEWREDPNNRRKAVNNQGGFNSVCEAM